MSTPAHRMRCKFPACDKVRHSGGWCSGHYAQQHRGNSMTPLAAKGHKGVLWLESELDALTTLRVAGKSFHEIAAALGRSYWAVKLKLRSITRDDEHDGERTTVPRCPRCHMLEPHRCVGSIDTFAQQRRGVEW